jgi:hypothetical protein
VATSLRISLRITTSSTWLLYRTIQVTRGTRARKIGQCQRPLRRFVNTSKGGIRRLSMSFVITVCLTSELCSTCSMIRRTTEVRFAYSTTAPMQRHHILVQELG